MIRYIGAALALRAFSVGPMPRVYRRLANTIGAARRSRHGVDHTYFERSTLFLDLVDQFGRPNGDARALELGTGWIHWYGLMLRLAYDCHIDLFDVVDNRQLIALKSIFARPLQPIPLPPGREVCASRMVEAIRRVRSFDEMYRALDLRYLLEPDGNLARLSSTSYDLIFSFHVLEHVHRDALALQASEELRLLKPGGLVIHQIGIDDHLAHFDRSIKAKHYLRYDDSTWSRCYENRIQYFNRVQRGQWLDLFAGAGFALFHEEHRSCSLDDLPHVVPQFRGMPIEDLACTELTLVFRKPPASAL